MPLDNQFDQRVGNLTEVSSDADELRKTHNPAEMLKLGQTLALAQARHADLLKFRRTWGGAVDDTVSSTGTGTETTTKLIDRAAIYPKSHILHFSVLASLVLFEGLANAYFFSTGSDLGLLGGWLQAITVSFTNVIAAFFLIGFLGLRHMSNPRKPIHAGLAAIGVAIGVLTLLALNLSAAHYRDLLEFNAATLAMGAGDVTGLVLAPVTAALANPFGIETLEALLLLVLGVTFAAIAAFKGRTFDDAIPGYGGVTRRLEAAASDLETALTAGWKDAKKLNAPELEQLVAAKQLHDKIWRDLAGPTIPSGGTEHR